MTNPTPHGQVPAIQRYKIGYHTDEWGVRSLSPTCIYDDVGQWVRYEDHADLVAAIRTQQPAPAGAAPLSDAQWQRIADLIDSILTRSVKDEIERVIGIKGVQHGTECASQCTKKTALVITPTPSASSRRMPNEPDSGRRGMTNCGSG